jgi:hypothetical protein
MFSYTGLTKAQCENMTRKWHVYMTMDGRWVLKLNWLICSVGRFSANISCRLTGWLGSVHVHMIMAGRWAGWHDRIDLVGWGG